MFPKSVNCENNVYTQTIMNENGALGYLNIPLSSLGSKLKINVVALSVQGVFTIGVAKKS